MRTWILPLMILTSLLAGCASEDKPETPGLEGEVDATQPGDGTAPVNPSPGANPSPATDSDPAQNEVPALTLTADVTTGKAPMTVAFTLDASDADGDVLAWVFDADGDGTEDSTDEDGALPYVVNFTFDAPGAFRAELRVTDGVATVNTTLDIQVLKPDGNSVVPRPPESWWVNWPLVGGACSDRIMTKTMVEASGCGSLYGYVGAVVPYTMAFPADAPSTGHNAGAPLVGSLEFDSEGGPIVGTIAWSLQGASGVVASGTHDVGMVSPLGSFSVPLEAALTAAIPANDQLTFVVVQETAGGGIFVNQASGFSISGSWPV